MYCVCVLQTFLCCRTLVTSLKLQVLKDVNDDIVF